MITPKQAADSLQVSTSTLRRWSSDFEPFLSPRKGVKRQYSVDDLALLKRVKNLFADGLTTAQISEALQVVETSAGDSALITIPDFAAALARSQAEQSKMTAAVEQLTEQVNGLSTRLDALTEWAAMPFYKRIGKKPPL